MSGLYIYLKGKKKVSSNVIEISSSRGLTLCEKWHDLHLNKLTHLLPDKQVVDMHRLVVAPETEQPVLQNSQIAALLACIPRHRILPTVIRWEKNKYSDRHLMTEMRAPETHGKPYEIVLFEPTTNFRASEDLRHLLYARSFVYSKSRILTHSALHRNPDLGFPNAGFGLFSDLDDQITSGRKYIQRFMEVLNQENDQLTFQATRYIQKFGLSSENSALKVISEVIATYLCGFGFSTGHGDPEFPFERHPMLFRLTKDFIEAHYTVSCKHD